MNNKIEKLFFSINTPSLLKEILNNNHMSIMRIPLQQLADRLGTLTDYIIKNHSDDEVLISIIASLSLLSFSDPYDTDYNSDLTKKYNEVLKKYLTEKSQKL